MDFDLLSFCGKDDITQHLNKPFNFDGRTIASNNHILVSIPEINGHEEIKESLKHMANKIINFKGSYHPIDKDAICFPEKTCCETCEGSGNSSRKTCDECSGYGFVESDSDYNFYEVDCKTCHGRGSVFVKSKEICQDCNGEGSCFKPYSHVIVLGIPINPNYLKQIMNIGGVEFFAEDMMLYFKSGEVKGAVMGMRV